MAKINFKDWYQSLSVADRASFATRARTTKRYIEGHLIHATKMPTPITIHNLAKATKGVFCQEEMIMFFYDKQHSRRQRWTDK